MKPVLKLQTDSTTSYLSIELKDILAFIEVGRDYKWKILWLEASGTPDGISMLELENIVTSSENGYLIGWDNLVRLSNALCQIIEIVMIGDKDEKKLIRYSSDIEMRSCCFFCIELVDSSYWEITSDDSIFLSRLKARFNI